MQTATSDELVVNEEKFDFNIMLQQAFLDKKNFLQSFEELAFIDPTLPKGRDKTEKTIHAMALSKNVYPDKLMESLTPPKCVFVPNSKMMRKIIKMQLQSQLQNQ